MTTFQIIKSSDVLIEIGQSSMKAHYRDTGVEIPLERTSQGHLSGATRENMSQCLRQLLRRKTGLGRPRALCAIGARGVLLRRLTLPPSSKEQFAQVLELQIEKEFPLPPDQLAWGYCRIASEDPAPAAGQGSQELMVVAVKRDVVEDYAGLLTSCGLNPVFTLGLLAASSVCSQWPGPSAVLDIGRHHSELISLDCGIPLAIRSLPWGGENITRALQEQLGVPREEAEKVKIQWGEGTDSSAALGWDRDRRSAVDGAIGQAVDHLAASFPAAWSGHKIFLTGKTAGMPGFGERLAASLDGRVECEQIEVPPREGHSAALLALRGFGERNGQGPPLVLQTKNLGRPARTPIGSSLGKWAALAVGLLAALVSVRYLEAWAKKPGLVERLSALESARKNRPEIDAELDFLQYVATNQPPYLEALALLAGAAPRGTSIQSMAMTRRGELTLRGTMANSRQATDFRSKLIESGWFTSVVLEEQTPVSNEKVNVRISAHWKAGLPAPPAAASPAAPSPPAPKPAATQARATQP